MSYGLVPSGIKELAQRRAVRRAYPDDIHMLALGEVPRGFIEVADPPLWTFRGTPQAQVQPPRPVFIRAELIPTNTSGPQLGAPSPPPRWVIYGGPMLESQYSAARQALANWAFWQRSMDGQVQGYFIRDQRVRVAPNGFHTQWPRQTFAWQWIYEPLVPPSFRWEQDPGIPGTGAFYRPPGPGNWVRVG